MAKENVIIGLTFIFLCICSESCVAFQSNHGKIPYLSTHQFENRMMKFTRNQRILHMSKGWDFLLRNIPTAPSTEAANNQNKVQQKKKQIKQNKRKKFQPNQRKSRSRQFSKKEAEEELLDLLREFRLSDQDGPKLNLQEIKGKAKPLTWEDAFTKLAKEFLFGGVPELAPEVFYTYEKALRATASASTSRTIDKGLAIAAIRGHFENEEITAGKNLYQRAISDGIVFDVKSKSVMLASLCKGGPDGVRLAFRMKDEMRNKGERPTARAFECLMEALWQNAEVALDTSIVSDLPKSYVLKRNSGLSLSLLQRSEGLYSDMLIAGLKSTDLMESHLVRCAFRSAYIQAVGTFEELNLANQQHAGKLAMKAAREVLYRHDIPIDFAVTTSILEENLNVNYTKGAVETLNLMQSNQLWARTSTFNTILFYFRSQKDVHGAISTLQIIEESKTVVPNNDTYLLVVQTCAASGDCVKEVQDVIKRAEVLNMANSKAFWDSRISVEYLSGKSLIKVLRRMEEEGYRPNEETLEQFIGACAERGDASAAFNVLKILKEKGTGQLFQRLLSSLGIYHSLLECCQKTKSSRRAMKLLDQMCKSRDPSPDFICFKKAITICIEANELDEALEAFSLMESHGYTPDQSIFALLIRGFGRRLDLGSALGVWGEVLQQRTNPSRSTYEAIIDACISHPQGLGHACKLIRDMQRAGYELGPAQYSLLVDGFGLAENMEKALESFRNVDFGVEVNEATLAGLVDACQRSGESTNIQEAILILRSLGIVPPRQIMDYVEKDKGKSDLYKRYFGGEGKGKQHAKLKLERDKKKLQHGRVPSTIKKGMVMQERQQTEADQTSGYLQFSNLLDEHFKNAEQEQFESSKPEQSENKKRRSVLDAPLPRIIEIKSREERKEERIKQQLGRERAQARKKNQ